MPLLVLIGWFCLLLGWVLGLIWLVACINSVVLVCLNSLCGGLVSYCVVGSSFVAVLCCFFLVGCACWYCCLYLRCLVGGLRCLGAPVCGFVVKFVFVFGVAFAGCDCAGCAVTVDCEF